MTKQPQTQQLVGLDFGTTNSLAALVVRGEIRSLVNKEDNLPHPSVVWHRGTDVIVDREAGKHLDTMRGATAQGFVRSPKMSLRREGPLHIEGRPLAKIQLSSKASHIVLVEDYLRGSGAARNLAVSLQAATQDIISRGLGEIDSLLDQARLDRRDIELCLATGGMVNMPAVSVGLTERFGGRAPIAILLHASG
jgi:molecular chaperone DnaK (HSP70)